MFPLMILENSWSFFFFRYDVVFVVLYTLVTILLCIACDFYWVNFLSHTHCEWDKGGKKFNNKKACMTMPYYTWYLHNYLCSIN